MSPVLFITVMDDILRATNIKEHNVFIGYHKLQPVTIGECAFADDVMICAKTEKGLQEKLNRWTEELKSRGMKMNIKKTKVMHVGREHKSISLTSEQEPLEQVNKMKYLGVIIDREGNMEDEIGERIQSATKVYHGLSSAFLGRKEIGNKTKMAVHRTIFRPILTYGSESWVLSQRDKSKIQAIDMKFLRKIKGVTKLDKIRNEVILKELGVEGTEEVIGRNGLKWFGHLTRMADERPVKRVWRAKIQKEKRRGRPKKTWDNTIAQTLEEKGIAWTTATKMAEDRKEWAKFVYNDD